MQYWLSALGNCDFSFQNQMVLPSVTVLKRRHSLEGLDLVPLLRMVRGMNEPPSRFARVVSDQPIDDLQMSDLLALFKQVTGADGMELLDLAGVAVDVPHMRCLLHFSIVRANEVGQPRGRALSVSFIHGG